VVDPEEDPPGGRPTCILRIRPGTDGGDGARDDQRHINEGLYDSEFYRKVRRRLRQTPAATSQHYTPEGGRKTSRGSRRTISGNSPRLPLPRSGGPSDLQGTCTRTKTANGTAEQSRAFLVLQIITGNINVPVGMMDVISPRLKLGNVAANVDGRAARADPISGCSTSVGQESPYAW